MIVLDFFVLDSCIGTGIIHLKIRVVEDADQHTSIRDELKSSLAEVLNTRKAREHELVECNKDLTRLKMSLKPLLVLNKSPK